MEPHAETPKLTGARCMIYKVYVNAEQIKCLIPLLSQMAIIRDKHLAVSSSSSSKHAEGKTW